MTHANATTITLHGHAAASLERGGRTLFIDPGSFSDLSALGAVDAVLVTHAHTDHLDVAAVAAAEAPVWAPSDVIAQLSEAGVAAERLRTAAPGETFEAAGFEVATRGGEHALVYEGRPTPLNNAYVIDRTILHPGDSLVRLVEAAGIATVLLPVAAPWLKLAEAIDFALAYPNAKLVPIHDAILSDAGKAMTDGMIAGITGEARYLRVAEGVPTAL